MNIDNKCKVTLGDQIRALDRYPTTCHTRSCDRLHTRHCLGSLLSLLPLPENGTKVVYPQLLKNGFLGCTKILILKVLTTHSFFNNTNINILL